MTTPGFYRSRIVLARQFGHTAAYGPVHSPEALSALERELEAAGWTVAGHFKLVSPPELRAMPEGDSR